MDVRLLDESGKVLEEVSDVHGALEKNLPEAMDGEYRCVGFIDAYDSAVFNSLQAPYLAEELARLKSDATPEDREFIEKVVRLTKKVKVGLHVKFIGD